MLREARCISPFALGRNETFWTITADEHPEWFFWIHRQREE